MAGKEDVVDWLYDQVTAGGTEDLTMGDLEKRIDQKILDVRRIVLQQVTQDTADREVLGCPDCGRMLGVVSHRRPRTVITSFGTIRFVRSYGFCRYCREYVYPADVALGLHSHARTSPRIQDICATMVLQRPAGKAEDDVRRLTGITISPSTLHREGRRQGERALALRQDDEKLTESKEGVAALAARAPVLPQHSTMVIEIDAWNIRERDYWGQTRKRRNAGEDFSRWHWVYTATVFRLDQCATTRKGRPVIADRGYVATRGGIDCLKRQLYAEALQRGLLQAETVLVLGDGAAWIWNLATDQFKQAKQRLDLYHVYQHLWELAGELHGHGTKEAEAWVRPYLHWLKRRKNGADDVIQSIEDLQKALDQFNEKQQQAIASELTYLNEHKDRMDYKNAKANGQPQGSGAIESTCSQYQRRFKRTGQFWSLAGDEAFLALDTLHRNQQWHRLFPHDSQP